MFCFSFDHEACGMLAPWLGIKPLALEEEVLTPGSPEKSLSLLNLM